MALVPFDKLDPAARLQRAKAMLESGLISDAEFESLKSKIVSER